MSGHHFPIEQEGNVSVEFFLELMKPLVRRVPRPRLMHGENYLAAFPIDPEQIDHGGIGDAGRYPLVLVLDLHRRKRPTSNAQRPTPNGRRFRPMPYFGDDSSVVRRYAFVRDAGLGPVLSSPAPEQ